MSELTQAQVEQGELFLSVLEEDPESIVLHPVIDTKTGKVRMGICLYKEGSADDYTLFLIGILLNSEDSLIKNTQFYEEDDGVILEKPSWWQTLLGWFKWKK